MTEIKREQTKIDISKKQKHGDYLVLRVQLVEVKKGAFFGLKDTTLAFHALIPNTRKEAVETFKQISKIFETKGVSLNG